MQNTPLSERTRIVLFGLTNSGKSSLLNNIFGKDVAIVSNTPGTTADPVTRPFELIGSGPVAFTDTAGLEDRGEIGDLREKKSRERIESADIILLITRSDAEPSLAEEAVITSNGDKPALCVLSFSDRELHPEKADFLKRLNLNPVKVDNTTGEGVNDLLNTLKRITKTLSPEPTPVEGLVQENDLVLLVTPIDLAAPKGRLILPQVETIRDLLDKDCASLICKERELSSFYQRLTDPPSLVITDSQAFSKVAADIPQGQRLTSFSILFARKKGELKPYIEGIKKMTMLSEGARILVLESCSHHRQADDIGTVKIPRLFKELVLPSARFSFEKQIPDNVEEYDLVITCASCMVTRRQVLNRLMILQEKGIPVLNYGMFLAWVNGLLPRALEPFPMEYALYNQVVK